MQSGRTVRCPSSSLYVHLDLAIATLQLHGSLNGETGESRERGGRGVYGGGEWRGVRKRGVCPMTLASPPHNISQRGAKNIE